LGSLVSYKTFRPASPRSTAAARGASKKTKTRPEMFLRRTLWAAGARGYRTDDKSLPGRPDIVFHRAKLAIFVDGDFWHGRDWRARSRKIARGTNAPYWLAKIRANIQRDRRHDARLRSMGWTVLRIWELDLSTGASAIVRRVLDSIG
jgi:DNA mismatch endonuclease (patch repair protein)